MLATVVQAQSVFSKAHIHVHGRCELWSLVFQHQAPPGVQRTCGATSLLILQSRSLHLTVGSYLFTTAPPAVTILPRVSIQR